jgi:UDP-N-acetylmuramate dehydrogenase
MHPFDGFLDFVKPDAPLAPLVWFRLGGPAAYSARPRTLDELVAVLRRAQQAGLAFKILGGGSNVLVRDEGVDALVVHLESPHFSDVSLEQNIITAGAAVPLTALISQTARAGLAGLEILTGIPGTVGGALRGNAGGRQGAIGQFVRRATVLDTANEIQIRERDDLSFADRESNLDEPVILSAEFELSREDPESVVRRMRRIWIVKKENQPYGPIVGVHFQEPFARCLGRSAHRPGRAQGYELWGRRDFRSSRQLHRCPSRCKGRRRPAPDRPDSAAGLAAIRIRVGTPAPDLVNSGCTVVISFVSGTACSRGPFTRP